MVSRADQERIQDFPQEVANSQMFPKTAWNWENFGPWRGACQGYHLRSAIADRAVVDIWFPEGRQPERGINLLFGQNFQKTAWKWENEENWTRVQNLTMQILHYWFIRFICLQCPFQASHVVLEITTNFRILANSNLHAHTHKQIHSIYLSSINHEPSILTMRRDGQKRKIIRKMCI